MRTERNPHRTNLTSEKPNGEKSGYSNSFSAFTSSPGFGLLRTRAKIAQFTRPAVNVGDDTYRVNKKLQCFARPPND